MKKILFISLSISFFSWSVCFAQNIDADVIGKKMGALIKYEEEMKSKVFISDDDVIVPGGMAIPVLYRRTESDIPDLIVHYTFDKKDSVIHQVLFDWDVLNFEKKQNNPKSMDLHKAFIRKYNLMLKSLQIRYGKGVSKGDLTQLSKIEQYGGLERSDTWIVKKRVQIRMYTVLSNYYGQNGKVIDFPAHRIGIEISPVRD